MRCTMLVLLVVLLAFFHVRETPSVYVTWIETPRGLVETEMRRPADGRWTIRVGSFSVALPGEKLHEEPCIRQRGNRLMFTFHKKTDH